MTEESTMKESTVTTEQRAEADETHGIVVEHLEDGEVTVAPRYELDSPARAQRVLYVSEPPPPPSPPDPTTDDEPNS